MKKMNPRGEMPFLDHLEELRWRIFKSAGAILFFTLVGFGVVYYYGVMDLLIQPVMRYTPTGRLNVFNPVTPFFLYVKLALIVGLILSAPLIIYEIWAFLAPALEDHERRAIIPSFYLGFVLFVLGVAMAYFLALPVSLKFLFGLFPDYLDNLIGVDEYLGFVVRLLVGFGIVFELPVVVMILTALGLATPTFLRAKRRHAVVIITVVASLLSPGDVIMVTLLMMVPLFLLYELSILLSALIVRRRVDRSILPSQDGPDGAVEKGDS
ncbi:MAG TPA: twin-arginine translocase subunit TatC [Longimicrobiales bacterium]|jgi:sec-independent protein translocase protein TatC